MGVKGSGFTVMLDLALSVLEPVMELKRELSSGRGIVTTCEQQSSNPRVGTKRTAGRFSGRRSFYRGSGGVEGRWRLGM